MVLLETLQRYMKSGWVEISDTCTYASADAPTFTFTIAGDVTGYYQVGAKLKLTQTTVKYFIITAIAYSAPNTTFTVYGGTDYTLANASISSVYYSPFKAPKGFPMDKTKWTVVGTASGSSQATPTSGTIYNIGGSFVIPIGLWNVSYNISGWCTRASTGLATMNVGLGTATNTFTNGNMYLLGNYPVNPNSTPRATFEWHSPVPIAVASKTTYYLNARVNATSHDPLTLSSTNSDAGMWAECAYL